MFPYFHYRPLQLELVVVLCVFVLRVWCFLFKNCLCTGRKSTNMSAIWGKWLRFFCIVDFITEDQFNRLTCSAISIQNPARPVKISKYINVITKSCIFYVAPVITLMKKLHQGVDEKFSCRLNELIALTTRTWLLSVFNRQEVCNHCHHNHRALRLYVLPPP